MIRATLSFVLSGFLCINAIYFNSCKESGKTSESIKLTKEEKLIDSLLDLAEQKPEDIVVLNSIADLALQNKDTGLAIHYLRQSLSSSPEQTEAAFILAGILQNQNDSSWKKIADHLIQSDDPTASSRGYFLIGVYWANKDKVKDAVGAFDQAISLNYSFTDPYIEKAIILLEKNEIEAASEVLYTALDLDRKSPDIHFLIGECWLKKKKPEKALPFYEETLKLEPEFVSAQKRIDEIKP
jgi:tetratricopeptide (TPR) repeat protein